MSHNVNSMMYVGEKPWHGLGTKVESAVTSAEAITKAGLDYAVEKKPIYISGGVEVPNHYATVRTDTNDALGVVGKKYTILQNKDAFRFFDGIVGVKEAMYQTAGALGVGEKIWLLAKLPGYVQTVKDDITEKYLLLANSHDGSGSVQIMFTPIRVVCQNTLNVGIQSGSNKIKLRHTASIGTRIDEVRETLGVVNHMFTTFEEASKKLATVQLTGEAWKNYLKNSGVIPDADSQDQSTRAKNIMQDVSLLFESGKGTEIAGVRGTAWGAFNAVTEYVDHHRGGSNPEKRAESLLYGSGANLKMEAWTQALKLV